MKESFYTLFEQLIKNNNFEKISDEKYEMKRTVKYPGQVISINGQIMRSPEFLVEILYNISIMGEGYYSNIDETEKREFIQINFNIKDRRDNVMNIDHCVYFDDLDYLKELFNTFLQ